MLHKPIRIGEISVTFLQSRHENENLLDLFEITIPSQLTDLPVPHLHRDYDETIIGMDGITTWLVDGKSIQVGTGEKLVIPRGAPHAFANHHPATARMMCILTPGLVGPEYFRDLAEVMNLEAPYNAPAMAAVMTRYRIIPLNA